jgi:hypothetical protein
MPPHLKLEPGFASRICQGLHPPVIKKAIAIKHDFADSGLTATFGDSSPDQLRRIHAALALYLVAE